MTATDITRRRIAGRIHYLKGEDVQGREDFAIDVREDGRTIRSYCEIDDDGLTRDASWTLDAAHYPVEGHVRVVQKGALIGSAWYRFSESETECESLTEAMGRSSQRLSGRPQYLGLHPLIGDGMIALARGVDEPGVERVIESVTCSYDINGETSLVALPIDIGVTYVGMEDIEVPAGKFSARRYALCWQPYWPAAHLWVHGDDALFLRLSWDVSGTTSELVKYGETSAPLSPQFDI